MMECIADAQFPQIPQLLAEDFMRDFLQAHWLTGRHTHRIESCAIGEKRYKPGKNFQISYSLNVLDRLTGARQHQLITARLTPANQPTHVVNLESTGLTYTASGFPALSYAPELNMTIWAFPHDSKLVMLPRLNDLPFLLDYFNCHRSLARLSANEQVVEVDYEVLHYLPEKSCMTRYRLTVNAPANSQHPRKISLYGKTYHDATGESAYAVMQQLAAQNPYCAKPLSYDSQLRTLWQAHVDGRSLEWRADLSSSPDFMINLASCISVFHKSILDVRNRYGFPEIFKQLDAACIAVGKSNNSTLVRQVNTTVHALMVSHRQIEWMDSMETPLHMDLKMGNILVESHDVTLIDMDNICRGDPLVDIGSFIANIYLNGLRGGAQLAEIQNFVDIFMGHYTQSVNWRIDEVKLDWYISAALIHEVLRRSLRQQDAERIKLSASIIQLSESYLQRVVNPI